MGGWRFEMETTENDEDLANAPDMNTLLQLTHFVDIPDCDGVAKAKRKSSPSDSDGSDSDVSYGKRSRRRGKRKGQPRPPRIDPAKEDGPPLECSGCSAVYALVATKDRPAPDAADQSFTCRHCIRASEPAVSGKEHLCNECDASFDDLESLRLHDRRAHHLNRTFRCYRCGHVEYSPYALSKHTQEAHDVQVQEKEKIECKHCGKIFMQPGRLHSHIFRFHKKTPSRKAEEEPPHPPPYICTLCPKKCVALA